MIQMDIICDCVTLRLLAVSPSWNHFFSLLGLFGQAVSLSRGRSMLLCLLTPSGVGRSEWLLLCHCIRARQNTEKTERERESESEITVLFPFPTLNHSADTAALWTLLISTCMRRYPGQGMALEGVGRPVSTIARVEAGMDPPKLSAFAVDT